MAARSRAPRSSYDSFGCDFKLHWATCATGHVPVAFVGFASGPSVARTVRYQWRAGGGGRIFGLRGDRTRWAKGRVRTLVAGGGVPFLGAAGRRDCGVVGRIRSRVIAGIGVVAVALGVAVATPTAGGADVLAFSAANQTTAELDGTIPTVDIVVVRTEVTATTVSVDYAVTGGNATTGADFTVSGGDSGTLTWAPDDATSRTISIQIADDNLVEGVETIELTLSNPVGATLGTTTVTVTINDDDNAGIVSFDSDEYSALENAGSVTITVTRAGNGDGAVSVDYTATDGTATAADYSGGDGTFTWGDGELGPRTYTITILDDSPLEGDETVNLRLSGPTGGLQLGTPSQATLTIIDDVGGPDDDRFFLDSSPPGGFDIPDLGDGSDTYRIDMRALSGPVTVDDSGSSGLDTVQIFSLSGDDELVLRTLADGRVQLARGAETITMRGIESLAIDAGAGVDVLVVDGAGTGVVPAFSTFTYDPLQVTAVNHETSRFVGTIGGARSFSRRSYWAVDTAGGVYAFGGAVFHGSLGGIPLNRSIVNLAATPSGNGYWMVASDGGIFAHGDAGFEGSTGGLPLNRPIVGMAPTPSGNG